MQKHTELTDAEFETKLRNCELDPARFTHQAHLRLAWIHIYKYGIKQALVNIQTTLQAYVASVGAEDKYNITLTVAATKAVYHFMLQSTSDNFKDFILEFPRLTNNLRDLLDQHYGFDIYNSNKAKTEYLEPDLLSFDC